MARFYNAAFAACVALVLSLGSIGAVVTVPPAQAATAAAFDLPTLA